MFLQAGMPAALMLSALANQALPIMQPVIASRPWCLLASQAASALWHTSRTPMDVSSVCAFLVGTVWSLYGAHVI